jgi:Arc-like DNA binding domain
LTYLFPATGTVRLQPAVVLEPIGSDRPVTVVKDGNYLAARQYVNLMIWYTDYSMPKQLKALSPDTPQWQFVLRLPVDMRQPLVELARANERSTSGEVRHALKRHLERGERETEGQQD